MPESIPLQPVAVPMAAVFPVMPAPAALPRPPLPATMPAAFNWASQPAAPATPQPPPARTPVPTPSAPDFTVRKDVFTDTPARYLGYSSEVTTATRALPLFASRFTLWNPLGWVITIGYGLGHALSTAKDREEKALAAHKPAAEARHEAVEALGEKLTFHTVATWVLPIVMIHATQKLTKAAFRHFGKAPGMWPILSGLAIIPVIPKIIDPIGETITEAATERFIKPFSATI